MLLLDTGSDNTLSFAEKKKAILEGIVVVGLVIVGIYSFCTQDTTNGAWALGLAGGYAFKNGVVPKITK